MNVERAFREYPSVQTLTVQSAFKFDYPREQVSDAIARIHAYERKPAPPVDEDRVNDILNRSGAAYQDQVRQLAPTIAAISAHIPRRRERKLHVGLFGYGRSLPGADDVTLPRAIAFAASLYSIGVPPDLLGLAALNEDDFAYLREVYPSLQDDLSAALRFSNEARIMQLLGDDYRRLFVRFTQEVDRVHEGLTTAVWAGIVRGRTSRTRHFIEEAALIHRFLG